MGASHLQPLLPLNSKSMVLENKVMYKTSSNGSLWSKVLLSQSMRRRRERKQKIKRISGAHGSPTTRILMKRRALLEGSRRQPMDGVERKVKTLKKIVPNGKTVGLDGLFRETADYILSLEMKVKVMQVMVDVLSDCNMI